MAGVVAAKASQAAARRGAALLDRVRKGWFWDVRVTKLDLSSGCNCIIGQVYGKETTDEWGNVNTTEYGDHVADVVGVPDAYCFEDRVKRKAKRFGFLRGDRTDYGLLTQAWANEVRTRRGFKPVDLSDPDTGRTLLQVGA